MPKKIALLFLYLSKNLLSYCQSVDSVNLPEVTIHSYFTSRPLLRLPSSASVINDIELKKQSGQSLVPVMNTVPGVRMEERSPASYRLSIRGSLLRSPFGIRNVKIYLEEFPLTDAGGNTYLNLLDMSMLRSIEVLKGPDGSLFGANSGGVIRLNVMPADTITEIRGGIGGGSYGLFNEYISVKQHINKNTFTIGEGWQRSDGYRDNSKSDRKYVQLTDQFQYRKNARLTGLLFYSNLSYQTPGGLTFQQWTDSPQSSRPATPVMPGAKQQHAGIYNSTFYTGFSNEIKLSRRWSNVVALFGSHTDFKNPFMTNYEIRRENTIGGRTWFQVSNNQEGNVLLKLHLGLEAAQTSSDIKNYNNNAGETGNPQKFDELIANQSFIFSHLMIDFHNKWLLEAGLSFNLNSYFFSTKFPYETARVKRNFAPQLMPKIAASYQIVALIALRASISKGYSTPTIAEIRSSTNEINISLQPENGWNYEAGLRLHTRNNFIWWDASAFYYLLDQAIVRRVNQLGQDYFVNAGGTKQTGIESQLMLQLIPNRENGFIREINISNSLTYSYFIFNNYSIGSFDYSGNKLTGIPSAVTVLGLMMKFPARLYLFLQHNYTSSIFLDDANSVMAKAYHLFLLKTGCKLINKPHFVLEISGGVDNLLNEKYSLGNDLNAAGSRYFNAAMPRNYFGKVEIRL